MCNYQGYLGLIDKADACCSIYHYTPNNQSILMGGLKGARNKLMLATG